MEDTHVTAEDPVSKWILFAVCDGHGGTGVVKYLEKVLSKRVLAALNRVSLDNAAASVTPAAGKQPVTTSAYAVPVRASYLRQAMKLLIVSLDSELERELKSSTERGSGSTLIMMAYQPLTRQIVLVNVGDSRAVLSLPNIPKTPAIAPLAVADSARVAPLGFVDDDDGGSNKGRKLIQTKDHKPCDKDELLRIAAAGSFVSKNRVGGILALSRAMGDFSLKGSLRLPYDPVSGAVCALPDVQVGYISPISFATAVLACDGIWDVMSSEEAVDVAEQALLRSENPAEKLVHVAFQKLSSDNLTCLVVRLHPVFRPTR
jgi:serine/threonine protein phosphatase PrpC